MLSLSCKESGSSSRGESPQPTRGHENKLVLTLPRLLVLTSMFLWIWLESFTILMLDKGITVSPGTVTLLNILDKGSMAPKRLIEAGQISVSPLTPDSEIRSHDGHGTACGGCWGQRDFFNLLNFSSLI